MELFSPGHLVVVLIVAAVLLFGWRQLPDMSRSLGRSLRIFKTELKGMSEDDKARQEQAAVPPVVPMAAPIQPAPAPVPAPPSTQPPSVSPERSDPGPRA